MTPVDLPATDHPLVSLRLLLRADAPAWYGYLCDPAVVRHTSWNLDCLDDLLADFDACESADPASPLRLAVVLRDGGALVGTIGLHTVSPVHRTAEIACDLAPAVWRQGVASAIVAAVADWSIEQLGLLRLQATVLETNAGSIRVLERCGFAREGYLRHYRLVRGKPGNFWMYSRIAAAP